MMTTKDMDVIITKVWPWTNKRTLSHLKVTGGSLPALPTAAEVRRVTVTGLPTETLVHTDSRLGIVGLLQVRWERVSSAAKH